MARTWTCKACGERWPRLTQLCPCGRGRRPKPRQPKHMAALELPYEEWVARFGETCGICGKAPSERRRLDRDHDHATGEPRGLLCFRCNRALPSWVDAEWLDSAAAYLRRNGNDPH